MVLVDSCVWIEAMRARGDLIVKLAVEALLDEGEATFCGPIRLEFLGGARETERERLRRVMSVVPYVPMQDAQWGEAVKLSWKLRQQGISAPWMDILIASIADRHQCRIYSLDKHFAAFEAAGIIRLYRPDYGGAYSAE